MTDRASASQTALGVARLRAAHQLFDSTPRILDDPVILRLLGDEALDTVRANFDRHQSPGARALRAHIVLRSRFAEDRLAAAVGRGVLQLVQLGAGFDTFAYRQPPWAAGLRVFEADHAASQRDKRDRLAWAGIAIPPNVTYLTLDLEREAIAPALAASGFDLTRPAFVSCLGVLMYLSAAANDAVLRFAASLPAGSELVCSVAPSTDASPAGDSPLAAMAASVGEPWVTRVEADALAATLRTLGFREVGVLTPDMSRERYFDDRPDGLTAPRRASIVFAVV